MINVMSENKYIDQLTEVWRVQWCILNGTQLDSRVTSATVLADICTV